MCEVQIDDRQGREEVPRGKIPNPGRTVSEHDDLPCRSKESRKVRWERLDEDLTYGAKDLDRSVVVRAEPRAWSRPALLEEPGSSTTGAR